MPGLSKMKNHIVVTGGAGFVGSNLIKSLLKNTNKKIISLDNYSSGTKKNHINNSQVKYLKANTIDISKNLNLSKVLEIYVNRGPGSFAGIRNSLSVVKAIHLVNKTDYYCFSFEDFEQKNDCKYENIPDLCQKFKIKKNLINPIYIS